MSSLSHTALLRVISKNDHRFDPTVLANVSSLSRIKLECATNFVNTKRAKYKHANYRNTVLQTRSMSNNEFICRSLRLIAKSDPVIDSLSSAVADLDTISLRLAREPNLR